MPFLARCRNQLWWMWLRDHHVRRVVVEELGAAATVAFGLLTILLAVWTRDELPAAVSAILALAVALCVWAIAHLFLVRARPDRYAALTLTGRPAPEVIRVLAYEIRRVCRRHARRSRRMARAYECFLHRRKTAALRKAVKRYRRYIVVQQTALQRLLAMKHLAADLLGLPQRQLCDHILRYRPHLHGMYASKALANWEAIVHFVVRASADTIMLTHRLAEWRAQNERFDQKLDSRIQLLEEIFEHSDLLPDVHALASQHSTSGALQKYADALARVGARLAAASSGMGAPDARYRSLCRKLQFLLDKQRAYSGMNLHHTCIGIAGRVPHGHRTAELLAHMLETTVHGTLTVHQNNGTGAQFSTSVEEAARMLQQFGDTVATAVQCSRNLILCRFVALARHWLRSAGDHPAILTHGYSKTVRELLKGLYVDLAQDGKHAAMPPVFILTTGPEDTVDSHRMSYELTDEPIARHHDMGHELTDEPIARRHDRFLKGTVAVADTSALSGLLSGVSPASVMVLLGAEAFDEHRCVIHPRGVRAALEELVRDVGAEWLKVVVAEGYKRCDDLRAHLDSYRTHLDRLTVYPGKLIDVVLCDTGCLVRPELEQDLAAVVCAPAGDGSPLPTSPPAPEPVIEIPPPPAADTTPAEPPAAATKPTRRPKRKRGKGSSSS